MSKTFDPREVEPQAIKRWAKDSGTLLGRLGLSWIVAWGLCLPMLAWFVDQAVGNTGWIVVAFFFMQVVGIVSQPVLQHALDQAADGLKPGIGGPVILAFQEIASHRQWLTRRVVGQMIALFILFWFTVIGVWLAANSAGEATPPPVPHPLNRTASLLVFLAVVPLFLRKHGLFDFSYWLQVRHGADRHTSDSLQYRARTLNHKFLFPAVLMWAGLYLLLSSHPVLTLMTMPVMQVAVSAMARCAYHDIFEGGTGVKEAATVTERDHALAPVLQA